MSRYEQKINKKNFAIKIILILFVLLLFLAWLYRQSQQEVGSEIKRIDIPIEKLSPSSIEKPGSLEDSIDRVFSPDKKQQASLDGDMDMKRLLPDLGNSDDSFKLAIGNVAPNLVIWFKVKDVIRKYIVLINDFSQKQILFKHRNFLKISQKIVIKNDSQGLFLAKESYSRFDGLANAIASIDVSRGLALYLTFRPLFVQVYNEFSYPSAYQLEDIFLKAAASVIDAPIVESRIALVKHSIRYKFADQKLESLNDIEKQMLRMGPENTKKIQSKLRLLVEAISKLDES